MALNNSIYLVKGSSKVIIIDILKKLKDVLIEHGFKYSSQSFNDRFVNKDEFYESLHFMNKKSSEDFYLTVIEECDESMGTTHVLTMSASNHKTLLKWADVLYDAELSSLPNSTPSNHIVKDLYKMTIGTTPRVFDGGIEVEFKGVMLQYDKKRGWLYSVQLLDGIWYIMNDADEDGRIEIHQPKK